MSTCEIFMKLGGLRPNCVVNSGESTIVCSGVLYTSVTQGRATETKARFISLATIPER